MHDIEAANRTHRFIRVPGVPERAIFRYCFFHLFQAELED